MQYSQDYDEGMVPAVTGATASNAGLGTSTTSYLWLDAMYTYVKSSQIYMCPSDSEVEAAKVPWVQFGGTHCYSSYVINAGYWGVLNAGGTIAAGTPTPVSSWSSAMMDGNGPYSYLARVPQIANPATTVWVADNGTMANGAEWIDNRSSYLGIKHPGLWPTLWAPYYWGGATGSGNSMNYCGINGLALNSTWEQPMPYNDLECDRANYDELSRIGGRHTSVANVLFCDGHVKAEPVAFLATISPTFGNGVFQYFTAQGS